jgi:hypothetical protein
LSSRILAIGQQDRVTFPSRHEGRRKHCLALSFRLRIAGNTFAISVAILNNKNGLDFSSPL